MTIDESRQTGRPVRTPGEERWYLTDERDFLQRSLADADREREAGDLSVEDHALLVGRDRARLAEVEALAEQMVEKGADRSSLVVAVGGGIVTDVAGFLAAIFMRGIPLIQIPTTLLGQVPLLPEIREGGDSGQPVTAAAPDGEAAKVFRQIAETLLEKLKVPGQRRM